MFKGQPDFVPIVGTQLLWASNTTSDVLIDTTNNNYYALLAGRWFRAAALTGPWTFVAEQRAARRLREDPADVARRRRAAHRRGHAAGAGSGDRELDSADGDGAAEGRADLHAATSTGRRSSRRSRARRSPTSPNSSEPVIQVSPNAYYAVTAGVWFTAAQLTGPWTVATSVPAVIYTIPPSSPIYYVTYVQDLRDDAGLRVRRLHAGLSRHRGRRPTARSSTAPATPTRRGSAASGIRRRTPTRWRRRRSTTPTSASRSASRWGSRPRRGWSRTGAARTTTRATGAAIRAARRRAPTSTATGAAPTYSGTRTWYGGGGVAGTTASGSYYNSRTGTSGTYNAGRQYNAWTGNASRGYDRTANTAAGGSANVARGSNYNVYSGPALDRLERVRRPAPAAAPIDRAGATTAGPDGYAHAGGGSTYNAKTGNTNTWGTASVGNNHYADVNGNVYSNTGRRLAAAHSSSGWGTASGNTSWADRESQARSFDGGGDRSSAASAAVAATVRSEVSAAAAAAVGAGASAAAAASAAAVSAAAAGADRRGHDCRSCDPASIARLSRRDNRRRAHCIMSLR